MEILVGYKVHHGPRYSGAGIKIQIHGNQAPGIYLRSSHQKQPIGALLRKGSKSDLLGPNFLKTGSIWVQEIHEHPTDSSEQAFYRVAKLVINQVIAYRNIARE